MIGKRRTEAESPLEGVRHMVGYDYPSI